MEKKVFLIPLFILLFLGSIFAMWVIRFNGITGFSIKGGSPDITFTSNFSTDYTNGSARGSTKEDFVTITNTGEPQVFVLNYTTTSTDVLGDNCITTSADYYVSVIYNNQIVTNGNLTLVSGTSYLMVGTLLRRNACPQDLQTEVNLFPA
jgi:hypothetical protein